MGASTRLLGVRVRNRTARDVCEYESRVYFQDLAFVEFVLRDDDEARVKDAGFEVVDDDPLNFRAESRKDAADQVVRLRTLPRLAAHRHGDCKTDAVININDKRLNLIAKENRTASAGGQHGFDLNLDNLFLCGHGVMVTGGV